MIKILYFCVLFPINAVFFTALTVYEWAVEMFNLPFYIWDEMNAEE